MADNQTISNNVTTLDACSLVQRLRDLSRPPQTISDEHGNVMSASAMRLRSMVPLQQDGQTTIFHSIYGVAAETHLSDPSIELGAIAALSSAENPSFIDLRQAYGDRVASSLLLPHIAMLNAVSGASNRMDDIAMHICAMDVMTAFPFVTIGEFCVFCARMRALKYVTKRSDYVFSQDTIMRGMHEFLVDRNQAIKKYNREHEPVEDMNGCVSWEEYCRLKGIEPTQSPLSYSVVKRVNVDTNQPISKPSGKKETKESLEAKIRLIHLKYGNKERTQSNSPV